MVEFRPQSNLNILADKLRSSQESLEDNKA